MTAQEQINLADLRARAERWKEDGVTSAATDLLALIDAVEAAARVHAGGPDWKMANHDLHAALARFSVTGRQTP